MHFSFFLLLHFSLCIFLYTYFSLHHSIFKHVFLYCITQTFLYNFPFEWKERNPYMGFIIDIMNIKPYQKFEPKVIASYIMFSSSVHCYYVTSAPHNPKERFHFKYSQVLNKCGTVGIKSIGFPTVGNR